MDKAICSCKSLIFGSTLHATFAEIFRLDFQKGQCRFGNYCALQHIKPGRGSSSPRTTGRPRNGTAVSTPATSSTSTGVHAEQRTIIPSSAGLVAAATAISGSNEVKSTPHVEPVPREGVEGMIYGLELLSLQSPITSGPSFNSAVIFGVEPDASSGFRSNEAWPSDYPEEEAELMVDALVAETLKPLAYSAIARTGIKESWQNGIGSESAIARPTEKGNDGPLCPFAIQGICRFGDAKCRYRHGLPCPICGKQCLDPKQGGEVHAGTTSTMLSRMGKIGSYFLIRAHCRMPSEER